MAEWLSKSALIRAEVKAVVREGKGTAVRTSTIVSRVDANRATIHRHLKALVAAGELAQTAAGYIALPTQTTAND